MGLWVGFGLTVGRGGRRGHRRAGGVAAINKHLETLAPFARGPEASSARNEAEVQTGSATGPIGHRCVELSRARNAAGGAVLVGPRPDYHLAEPLRWANPRRACAADFGA